MTVALVSTRRATVKLVAALALCACVPASATQYPVVDTGQTQCYDSAVMIPAPESGAAFYGQDAQYAGNEPSLTLSGDGLTVHDNVTGLTWMAMPDGDGDGVLVSPDDKMSWWDALAYPVMLNTQSFGGYDDWRLPGIKELYSLIDFRGIDPSGYTGGTSGLTPFINTDCFAFVYGSESAGERVIDSQYWTTTEYVGTTMNGDHTVFGVNFADGRIKGYPTTDPMSGGDKLNFALCVRGGGNYGINAFADNGDGTVTDAATGLVWQQADSGYGMTWEDALAYAEGLSLAGHDDWRLPNVKELQSILDYTRSPQTTGSPAIDPVFACTPITDEGGGVNWPFYWSSTTHANWSQSPGAYGCYVCFGEALGWMQTPFPPFDYVLMDVHGAGAQRSDPKVGDPADWPHGHGPQGDVIRIYNYVRCVRDTGSTGGVEPEATSSMRWHPNPFSDSTELTLTRPAQCGELSCTIYDAAGRAVASLEAADNSNDLVRFTWDGVSDTGAVAASGTYFAEVESDCGTTRMRIVRLK